MEERFNLGSLGSVLCMALSDTKVTPGAVGSGVVNTTEVALAEIRAENSVGTVIAVCSGVDMSTGLDGEFGVKVGQSRSVPATEIRRGRSLASIKPRLSRDGLGALAREAMGRDGKGFSALARRVNEGKAS